MAEPILRIERVTKRFSGVTAVDRLDLAVEPGAFVTLLGPSGCGKSTTLRMLGGFETPDEGRVILGGEDVTNRPPETRDVNMVFQDYALFPHMTAAGNVAFGLELKGMARDAIAERVDELFRFLRIEGLENRTPEKLSGGQRQRVALARALAPDPKLLLLDEPLAALDAKLRAEVQVELKSIQRTTGKTFIFVTHDQEEALTMSDRVVVMNEGRIEQDGTPQELYHRPATRFVADFIGESNLLGCRVVEVDGEEVLLDWQGQQLRAARHGRRVAKGAAVDAALRPECIRLGNQPLGLANGFPGRIVERLFRGPRVRLTVVPDGGGEGRFEVSLDPAAAADLGDGPIEIGFAAERVAILEA